LKLAKYVHKRARIEIVPMIDTIFFLLVYFMVASLTMTQMASRKVSLPVSDTANARPDAKVIVTVTKAGRCYIDQDAVDEMRIKPTLDDRLRVNPKLTVVINCDKDQPVASFTRVLDLVKQTSAASVMVATTPRDPWSTAQ
jgi:biopolymer transport protein ExbD